MSTVVPSHQRDDVLPVAVPAPRAPVPTSAPDAPQPAPPGRDPVAGRPRAATRARWAWAIGALSAGVLTGALGIVAVTAPAGGAGDAGVRAVPTAPLTSFGDGTWEVGRDVLPGTYAATGSTPACRHTGTPDRGQAGVVLADGRFETSGCGTWNRAG
jgi:hypothetical protein